MPYPGGGIPANGETASLMAAPEFPRSCGALLRGAGRGTSRTLGRRPRLMTSSSSRNGTLKNFGFRYEIKLLVAVGLVVQIEVSLFVWVTLSSPPKYLGGLVKAK